MRALTPLLRLHRVRLADDPDAIAAVQRLRYEIFVEEGGDLDHDQADHDSRRIVHPADSRPGTRNYFVRKGGRPVAALRARTWPDGSLPQAEIEFYAPERLPSFGGVGIGEIAGIVAARGVRGGLSTVALLTHALERAFADEGVRVVFASCVPGLLRSYERLGLRRYGAPPIATPTGLLIPLVGIFDREHFEAVHSPLAPMMARLERKGHGWPRELDELREHLNREAPSSNRSVEEARALAAHITSPPVSLSIDPSADGPWAPLLDRGVLLDVPVHTELVREGATDRDLHWLLEGTVEVRRGDRPIRLLGPGAVFGDLAFLGSQSGRSASVHALEDSRVLVLRHATFERLEREDPPGALAVLKAAASLAARAFLERESGGGFNDVSRPGAD